MSEYKFPSDLNNIKDASQAIVDELSDVFDKERLIDIKLCFEEAYINAIKYGNKQDAGLTVDVEIKRNESCVEMFLCDYGEGFDINEVDDPTKEENLSKKHGRGILLIKNYMDDVSYDKDKKCLYMRMNVANQ